MSKLRLPSATYANVMSTVAVFIALGGVSWAAVTLPKDSVGATQLRANAVTGAKVKNGSIGPSDLSASAKVAGPQGPAGAPGPAGPTGPAGSNATVDGVAAGGALAGTYPSPSIAAGAVGGAVILDGSVTAADLAPGALAGVVAGGPRTTRSYLLAGGKTTQIAVAGPGGTAGTLEIGCTVSGDQSAVQWTWTNTAGATLPQHVSATWGQAPDTSLHVTGQRVSNGGVLGVGTGLTSVPNFARPVAFRVLGKGGAIVSIEGQGAANDAGLLACRAAIAIQVDDPPLVTVN